MYFLRACWGQILLSIPQKDSNYILQNNIEIIIQGVFFIPGQEMAQEYNFPEEIIAHGFFDNWNVIECIKNMNKLVLISNETPVKKRRNWYFSFYHHNTLNAKLKQKLRNETHEKKNEIKTDNFLSLPNINDTISNYSVVIVDILITKQKEKLCHETYENTIWKEERK